MRSCARSHLAGEASSRSPLRVYGALEIPFRLPQLNRLIGDAKLSHHRYAGTKRSLTTQIAFLATQQELGKLPPAYYSFVITEQTLRRDPDGLLAAAMKFVFDALQKARCIPNDGHSQVLGICAFFDRGPSCIRIVAANRPLLLEETVGTAGQ